MCGDSGPVRLPEVVYLGTVVWKGQSSTRENEVTNLFNMCLQPDARDVREVMSKLATSGAEAGEWVMASLGFKVGYWYV